MLHALISFAALCGLCLFFTSLPGVKSAAAPLLSVSAVMVFFSLAGMAGVLVPAGWVFFALCAALGVYAFVKRGGLGLVKQMASPGFLLFFGLGLVLLVYLGVRQPVFSEWDEFVFWGIAPKLLKQDGILYTTANVGFFWPTTQFPGLPVLGWFVQFWAPEFAPWCVYWGYGLLYLACVAALISPFGARRWRIAVPLGTAGLLLPFFFTVPYHAVYFQKTWLSAYADLPAGMLFGGALVLYFAARQSRQQGVWQAVLPLCALVMTKDNVFPVALVAAGVMAADVLLFGTGRQGFARVGVLSAGAPSANKQQAVLQPDEEPAAPKPKVKHGLWRRVAIGLGLFTAPAALYFFWQRHCAWAVARHPIYQGNLTHEPVSDSLRQAFAELFGLAPKSENFYRVLTELSDSFLGRVWTGTEYQNGIYKVSMAGTGLFTLLLIVLVFAAAAILCGSAHKARRMALCGGLLLGGFAAYHFMLFVVYAYFSHTRDEGIFDYARYTNTLAVGMLMVGLLFLALAAKWGAGRRGQLARALVLVLAVCMLGRTAALVRPGYSVLDYPADVYDIERQEQAVAQRFADAIEPGGRVFFVCQGGDGSQYMRWHYHLLPHVLEYSITGGGTMLPPPPGAGEDSPGITTEEITTYLDDYGCEYILIDRLDEDFIASYGGLFAEGLRDYEDGPALYRRDANGRYVLLLQQG